jgi:hypothetical protein
MLQPLDQRLEQQGGQLLAGHPVASEETFMRCPATISASRIWK